jgi:hypothetical protein
MTHRFGPLVAITLAIWSSMAGAAQAQPTLNVSVSGATVTFNWSGGTAPFVLQAGVASGAYLVSQPLGNVTTFQTVAPGPGVYFARIVDSGGAASNEVQAVVASVVPAPAVPTPVQVFRNGTGVVLAWAAGSGGGPVSGYRLRVGLTPGGAELGVIPTNATGFAAGGVPPGTYYLGIAAVNASGSSGEATESALVMPAGGACDAPPTPTLTTTAWGSILTATWSAIPGAGAYFLNASGPGFSGQVPFAGNQTSFLYRGLPAGTWSFGIQAQFSCGSMSAAGQSLLVVDGSTLKMQPRAPDPALGIPGYAPGVIADIGNRFSGDLRNSCKEHGGNNRWLFRVVQALREHDKRWGLNWKRANFGDMSQDVITYNWGEDGDEGTHKVRAWDVIGGHCGNSPGWQFSEITNPKPPAISFGAIWTLIPYIEAGFVP